MFGFLDRGGEFITTRPVRQSTAVTANGINDPGQIVGFYTATAAGRHDRLRDNDSRAFDLGDDAAWVRRAWFPRLSQGTTGDAKGRLSLISKALTIVEGRAGATLFFASFVLFSHLVREVFLLRWRARSEHNFGYPLSRVLFRQGFPRCIDRGVSLVPRELSALGETQRFEIGDQPGPGRFPSQLSARLRAGGGHVVSGKHAEPAEKGGSLFRGDGFDRQFQAPADRFGDIAQRHAFFRDRVILCVRLGLFDRQPVETGDVEKVRGGPAIKSVADIGARALCAIRSRSPA